MRFALTPCALAAVMATTPCAWAQPVEAAVTLKPSVLLQEHYSPQETKDMPLFVQGAQVIGQSQVQLRMEGGAELRHGDTVIRADRLSYEQFSDLATAEGQVRMMRGGNVYEGPKLQLKVDAFEGEFQQPRYKILATDAKGEAERIEFIDQNRMVAHQATYSTCERNDKGLFDWVLKTERTSLDFDAGEGVAEAAVLTFKGVPVLGAPRLTFPLDDARLSGWLPPTFGSSTNSGQEFSLPYYVNLAPNRDVTLTPYLMSRRGTGLDAEFRYLESHYSGVWRLNEMPSDKLSASNRYGLSVNHQASLAEHLGLKLNFNRVSDDQYWKDFPNGISSLTQRLLPQEASLNWAQSGWQTRVLVQQYQILQSLDAHITPPYERLPQVTTQYAQHDWQGYDLGFSADVTRFMTADAASLQKNGDRMVFKTQLSRPWVGPWAYVNPKVSLHAAHYSMVADSNATQTQLVIPTASLDAGLVFERDAQVWGRGLTQTLEPRAFYVRTPLRDQTKLPNFDSSLTDFNSASIFAENAWSGMDRVSDENQLTLALGSRFLDRRTGAQLLNLTAARRYRFMDAAPGLEGAVLGSDYLFGGTANLDERWSLDTALQYNPDVGEYVRSTVSGRYTPKPYHALSLSYRLQRPAIAGAQPDSEFLEAGWQWPLANTLAEKPGAPMAPAGRWYSVGRASYNRVESRLTEMLLGFEYDAGCWVLRIAKESLSTSLTERDQRLLFQLEFVGFSRLGVGGMGALKQSIPRYQTLHEQITRPSRFGTYE